MLEVYSLTTASVKLSLVVYRGKNKIKKKKCHCPKVMDLCVSELPSMKEFVSKFKMMY